jgi:asparagine synthase (glutamine-hydrolysing)
MSCGKRVTWDVGAILSIVSFSYPCGNRTLLNEVRRSSWLSKLQGACEIGLETIAAHGRLVEPVEKTAETLYGLLSDEVMEVCSGRKEVYVLLSGGLDSRIVAGVLHRLLDEGRLSCKVIAVTWGLPDCRDVHYGRAAATVLGFEWQHMPLAPEDILKNIDLMADKLGGTVPPQHLHSMSWFKNVPKDALVLAGSYGDSVGRAEYSGKHLLQLKLLRPANNFGILSNSILKFAYKQLLNDLAALHNRTPGVPYYVLCEHEQEGHYMRGMLGHTMSIINEYANIYQVFTHPRVYSYMWSLHPATRSDEIYATLIPLLHPRLLEIPWARTNRALKGKTVGASTGLKQDFHDYKKWVGTLIYDQICQIIDPEWFAESEIFDAKQIRMLSNIVRSGVHGTTRTFDLWLWLATFRRFAEHLEKRGKTVKADISNFESNLSFSLPTGLAPTTISLPSKILFLNVFLKRLRNLFRRIQKSRLKRDAIVKYPPEMRSAPEN